MNAKPRIVHVLYRLDTGGMENILVTLINQTCQRYRHALICLEGFSTFRERITDPDVPCVALHKKPGTDIGCYLRLWRTLKDLKPDLVQTYNIGAIDAAPVAKLAGVRCIVHAEHGRDASDPQGERRKYRYLRRGLSPCIDRFVAVSRELEDWLNAQVGIPQSHIVHIANGIDTTQFHRAVSARENRPLLKAFAPPGTLLIGTVGRLDAVKDQAGLITAFDELCELLPELRDDLRLVIIGEGPQRAALESQITNLELGDQVQLLGNRSDVASLLTECDIFVLSSVAEGMPVTLLEAMAVELPVVATDVGGMSEVVLSGNTGLLVPMGDPQALAKTLSSYVLDNDLRARHGAAGRERVETGFSLSDMVSAYTALYDGLLGNSVRHPQAAVSPGVAGRRER